MHELEYGSDVAVELLKNLDIDYVAFNPGATFRGLHESIVNYGENEKPEVIVCCHEEIAVSLCQGYAKAALKPMAAAVHDIVGLLHATMAIYLDWLDQTPVLILGGTGPMAVEERRPWIDWIHTALVQGNVVRDYVKWDDQPGSVESFSESFYRAYRAAMSEPKGPVYVCLDAGLQEQSIDKDYKVPDFDRYPVSTSPQADPAGLEEAAKALVGAERPVVMADYLGRNSNAVASLVELAELLALPVIDVGSRFNFPSTHPLDISGSGEEYIDKADVVLGLDMADFYHALTVTERTSRIPLSLVPEDTRIIHIGLQELLLRGWSQNIGKLQPMNQSIMADTSLALPELVSLCRQEMVKDDRIDREKRFEMVKAKHESLRAKWWRVAVNTAEDKPISFACLAAKLWEVVRCEDWILVNRTLGNWTRRLWDWNFPHQWIGAHHGGAVGYGVGHSLGAALAHKGSGSLCIDIQPDGDFLYTPSALWTAAHHEIPLLIVMFNNRSYGNSENHQRTISEMRRRPTHTSGIGTRIENPPVDFATLARGFGIHGEGPIEEPKDIRPALERAVGYVKEKNSCALVDVITQPR